MSGREPSGRWRALGAHLAVLASYLLLSAVFTWPAVCFDPSVLVTRQFDLLPTVWLVEQAPGTFPHMLHHASAWPFGESLARADSYVLLILAWLNHGLLSGKALAHALMWIGPALSAWAAEYAARSAMDVPRPWSLLAGVIYGFSGVMALAALEGHVYHMLNPWLPLMVVALRGQRRGWRALLAGALGGGAWCAALFTSAYMGILATSLGAVLLLRRPRAHLLSAGGLATVVVPAGLYYLYLFRMGGRWADGAPDPALSLDMGAVTLGGLLSWSDAFDLGYHSISAPVGFTGLALLGLSVVWLRGERGWRALAGLAAFCLLATLGRSIRLDLETSGLWSPLALAERLPGMGWFRFPVRLAWLYALGAGLVGARVLYALSRRLPARLVVPVLGLAVVDALVGTGLPFRQREAIGTVPSAYEAAPPDRAVLDLWGMPFDRSRGEMEMWARNLSCFYQAGHHRPILEVCIGTRVNSPREAVDAWWTSGLFSSAAEDVEEVRHRILVEHLATLGVGAVAVHADFYRPADVSRLLVLMERALGSPAAESLDGGERVVLFRVPERPGGDPLRAWSVIRGEAP